MEEYSVESQDNLCVEDDFAEEAGEEMDQGKLLSTTGGLKSHFGNLRLVTITGKHLEKRDLTAW